MAGIAFTVMLLLFAAMGVIAGGLYNAMADIIYQSEATIQISPNCIAGNDDVQVKRLVEICDAPHHELIISRDMIKQCLEQNNLLALDSFVGLSANECFDLVQENVRAKRVLENGGVYQLELRSKNPQDTATVLNNLVSSYFQKLIDDHPGAEDGFSLLNCEVARTGDQVWPILPLSIAIELCLAVLLAVALWFWVNPFKFNLLPISMPKLFAMLAIVLLSFVAGSVVHSLLDRETWFESTASINVETELPNDLDVSTESGKRLLQLGAGNHEHVMTQYAFIESTLEKNNLFILDIFLPYAKEEAVELIQDSLSIVPDDQDAGTLVVTLQASDSKECKTCLNAIVNSYVDLIDNENKRLQDLVARNQDAGGKPERVAKKYQATIMSAASDTLVIVKATQIPNLIINVAATMLGLMVSLVWCATMHNESATTRYEAELTEDE